MASAGICVSVVFMAVLQCLCPEIGRADAADNNTEQSSKCKVESAKWAARSWHYVVRLPFERPDVAGTAGRSRLEPLIETACARLERNAIDRRTATTQRHGGPHAAVQSGRAKTRRGAQQVAWASEE